LKDDRDYGLRSSHSFVPIAGLSYPANDPVLPHCANGFGPRQSSGLSAFVRALRAGRYDLALVVTAVNQQLRVKLCKRAAGMGDPSVAAEVSPFAFYATLLVAFAGVQKSA